MTADESLETLLGTAARLRPDLTVEVLAGSVKGCPMGRLVDDSRQVEPGHGFVARPGTISDGSLHIGDALGRGASLVIAAPSAWSGIDPKGLGEAVGLACDQPLELGITLAEARRRNAREQAQDRWNHRNQREDDDREPGSPGPGRQCRPVWFDRDDRDS